VLRSVLSSLFFALLGVVLGLLCLAVTALLGYEYRQATQAAGWTVSYSVGRFDSDERPMEKALVAVGGLGALVPEEALYYNAVKDDHGAILDASASDYVLRFAPGELPDTGAFWSLTLYGQRFQLVDNAIDRYSIGDRTADLHYAPDGSLEVYISSDRPAADTVNWLPAPDGIFVLTLRAYLPSLGMQSGQWSPPPIQRQDVVRGGRQ